jgi:UDP-N-acetylglucosamine--N-acetylmuramyl-(pentapeptide) pyrophosphoryl-undecaprenol N-acetylglucosamine transferase
VLVPGGFGSGRHQDLNAAALRDAGAAVVVAEDRIGELPAVVKSLIGDPQARRRMAEAATKIAKPDAAMVIARAMIEMASA